MTETKTVLLGRYDPSLGHCTLKATIRGRECEFNFDLRQPTQRYIAECINTFGGYEPNAVMALLDALKEGDVFLDVGAHVGYFSIVARAMVGPRGRILAFEADPTNAAQLERSGVATVVNAAVGNRNGFATFYTNLDNDGGHSLWNPATHPHNERTRINGAPSTTVPIVRLDDYCDDDCKPAAIKIDTEGAEMDVLRGAVEILKQPQLKLVICENNEWGRAQLRESGDPVAFMAGLGFTVESEAGIGVGNWFFRK